MQKLKNILIIIFSSVAIILGLLFYSNLNKKEVKIINKRVYEHGEVLSKISLKGKYSQIKEYNNNIFLLKIEDDGTNKILKYFPKNNSFKTEYELDKKTIVGNYYINSNSNMFFFKDNYSGELKIKKNNKKLHNKKLDLVSNRSVMINDSIILLTTWNNSYTPLYYKLNINSNLLENINVNPNVYKKFKYPGIELDGMIIYNNNFIYLIPYGQNLVLIFDKKIDFVKSFNLNFESSNFEVVKSEKQTLIDPNNIYPNFSAAVDDSYIYILTNETGKFEDNENYFIDIYDVNTNKYKRSIKIKDVEKNIPKEIAVNSDNIYVLNEKNITVYEKN